MVDIQKLLNIIRPKVSGRSQASKARFQTSDVTQECALQLIKEFRKKEAEGVEPEITKSWLAKIGSGTASKLRRTNNAACRSVERETREDVQLNSVSHSTPDELAAFREMQSFLVLALTRLTPEENEIIDLRYNNSQTISAIARTLDLPRHQVQSMHDKALDKIREDLQDN